MILSKEKIIEAFNLMNKQNNELFNKFMNIEVKLSGINPDNIQEEFCLSPINLINFSSEESENDLIVVDWEYLCSVHGVGEDIICKKCGDKTIKKVLGFK